MKIVGIYKIQSKIKPERIYIGSAIDIQDRWRHHKSDLVLNKHTNKKLQNHYNKYDIKDLQFSLILTCNKDKKELIEMEQFFIDSYKPWFNINPKARNRLGSICSEESRKRMSERMMGNKLHTDHRHSNETKQIMSYKKIGSIPWNKGGAYYSAETRNKMSMAKKGKPSPKKGNHGIKWTDETRQKYIKVRTGMKYKRKEAS